MSYVGNSFYSSNGFTLAAGSSGAVVLDVANKDGTGASAIPVGTTAQRPGIPYVGMQRWNTTLGSFEVFDGTIWGSVGGGATNGVFYGNNNTITANFTSTSGQNYSSTGPITHTAGVVTINNGSVWKVI